MKGQNYKDFVVKNVLFKIYDSFNCLIELCHLELLMSAEKLQKHTMAFYSQRHREFLYCLTSQVHVHSHASMVAV